MCTHMGGTSAMGAASNPAVTATNAVPTLTGTPSQVSWASDIRDTMRRIAQNLNAKITSGDRNDAATAGAEISAVANALGLDVSGIGRSDLVADQTQAYNNLIGMGYTQSQARKAAFAVDRESAAKLSSAQASRIKSAGATRAERDAMRAAQRTENMQNAAAAIRAAVDAAIASQTSASWWIDRRIV